MNVVIDAFDLFVDLFDLISMTFVLTFISNSGLFGGRPVPHRIRVRHLWRLLLVTGLKGPRGVRPRRVSRRDWGALVSLSEEEEEGANLKRALKLTDAAVLLAAVVALSPLHTTRKKLHFFTRFSGPNITSRAPK